MSFFTTKPIDKCMKSTNFIKEKLLYALRRHINQNTAVKLHACLHQKRLQRVGILQLKSCTCHAPSQKYNGCMKNPNVYGKILLWELLWHYFSITCAPPSCVCQAQVCSSAFSRKTVSSLADPLLRRAEPVIMTEYDSAVTLTPLSFDCFNSLCRIFVLNGINPDCVRAVMLVELW